MSIEIIGSGNKVPAVKLIKVNEAFVLCDQTYLVGDILRLPRILANRLDGWQQNMHKEKRRKERYWWFEWCADGPSVACRPLPELVMKFIRGQVPVQMVRYRKAHPQMILNEKIRREGESLSTLVTPANDPLLKLL